MSVNSPANGEYFSIRIYKANSNNISREWANTYEVQAQAASTLVALKAAAAKIVAFEKLMHAPTTEYLRSIISTWIPDGAPYDPISFVSEGLTGFGSRSGGTSNVLPTGIALYLSRDVTSGRMGRLFYRGALFESEMSAPAGIPKLDDPAAFEAVVQAAIVTSDLDEMFSTGGDPFYLVMKSEDNSRVLLGLTSRGVRLVKTDHRYYDRAP